MRTYLAATALLALLASSTALHAGNMRCGTALVVPGDSKLRVLDKCGEPDFRETVSGANERRVEQWYYRSGTQRFTRVVTFRGTRIEDIEILTRD